MTKYLKARVLCVIFAIPLLQATVLTAEAPPAPIPAQILAAKKVFVANAGGDEWWYETPQFGGADRAYNSFYDALKTWGRYELIAVPADADLLFEIRFSVVPIARRVVRGDSVGSDLFDPQFQLSIRDPKTHAVLWGLTEHLQWALRQGNRDKNFDQGLAKVVAEVKRIAAQSVAAAGGAK